MTFVGVLGLAAGAWYVVDGVHIVSDGGSASRLAAGAFDLALGALAVVIGTGALRLATWAWAAFMTWAVIGLTHELLRHFFYDNANYASLVVDTAVVLLLTPLDIQVAFGVRSRPGLATDGRVDGGTG